MQLSAENPNELETDPSQFIEHTIKEFVRTSPDNRLSFLNDYVIFGEPLVGFAYGDDPIFTEYKKKTIIAPEHLTPREALAKAYAKATVEMPGNISVISWILPIEGETRKSNRIETRLPSRLWSHTRWYGEKLNNALRAHVATLLVNLGYLATAPFSQPYFKVYRNEKGPYSNWSERHIAYAAGLGTFSLSDGFITERGVAIRCSSVVTNMALSASSRTASSPYSNCLYYAGMHCRSCIERCPAGAIDERGHNKEKCQQYMHNVVGYTISALKNGYDVEKSNAGCGLCQTKVPCEFHNPTSKLKHDRKSC